MDIKWITDVFLWHIVHIALYILRSRLWAGGQMYATLQMEVFETAAYKRRESQPT